jgi:glycosyltransferase involved in cell wall biosynthesis
LPNFKLELIIQLNESTNQQINNRVKVLFLIDSLQTGGTETSLLETLSHFKGIEPVVIYLFPRHDLLVKFEKAGIKVQCLDVGNKSLLNRILLFNRVVKENKPNLIVSTLFKSDLVARIGSIFNRIPLVGTFVNDSYSDSRYRSLDFMGKFKLKLYQILDRMSGRLHHSFIANGENIRASNAKVLGIDLDKIVVIRRGRNIDRFMPPAIRDLSEKKFLTVGRLIPRKGHADLITAMMKVINMYPDSNLTIAGDGPERRKLEILVEGSELQNHVHFSGDVSKVEELLGKSSYFILPSHYEGFSGALIEAMLNEIPIIASAIPMNLEAVTHLETAVLFGPGNVGELSDAMLWMIENPDKAGEMAKKARNHALQEFNIKKIAARYEEYLLSVIPPTNKQINK